MTNMPESPADFTPFAIVLVTICIPFFSIIGFLSTKYGYSIWAQKTKELWRWLRLKTQPGIPNDTDMDSPTRVNRTMSTEEGMRLRLRGGEAMPMGVGVGMARRRSSQRPAPSHPHIQRMVERMGEGRESGLARMGTVVADDEHSDSGKEKNGGMGKDAVIDIREP
jgi:hypothetical protein